LSLVGFCHWAEGEKISAGASESGGDPLGVMPKEEKCAAINKRKGVGASGHAREKPWKGGRQRGFARSGTPLVGGPW